MRSQLFQKLLWENAGFSAQPGIYLGTLENFSICVPPLHKQRSICAFLLEEQEQFNVAIAQAETEIELIQEYRTTLISDAITGKIDVRDMLEAPVMSTAGGL